MTKHIAFQGEAGAYSHLACSHYHPNMTPLPCPSFQAVFTAVQSGKADAAMIPVENTLAGRVSDIYHLLPEGNLFITEEHYLPIRHQLLGIKGAVLSDIKIARSHAMALGQVRKNLLALGIAPMEDIDTAGAAQKVALRGDKAIAAVASTMAAQLYNLDILKENIEDEPHNTTRFLTLARKPAPAIGDGPWVTSFIFKVRNVPSALYKALGGFATNSLNMTKLESYMIGGSFTATQFYADVEGHPDDTAMGHALEELRFFSEKVIMLGTYAADPSRETE
ncbi:prephenate dehydratase [Robiginitomaculum antarcticum]|uniref:prephenate dehydratase n=1 Tax=Robiginitomaculum antarcticum TaxID=437507 RepID=UPI000362F358|nr:prephenate dehydratase [Robiginitomaculum antarcticum]